MVDILALFCVLLLELLDLDCLVLDLILDVVRFFNERVLHYVDEDRFFDLFGIFTLNLIYCQIFAILVIDELVNRSDLVPTLLEQLIKLCNKRVLV